METHQELQPPHQFILEEGVGLKVIATRLEDGFFLHLVNLVDKTIDAIALSDKQIYDLYRYAAIEEQDRNATENPEE